MVFAFSCVSSVFDHLAVDPATNNETLELLLLLLLTQLRLSYAYILFPTASSNWRFVFWKSEVDRNRPTIGYRVRTDGRTDGAVCYDRNV
jgi:hypothetical protein